MTKQAVLPLLAALAGCACAATATATANSTTSTVIDIVLPMLNSDSQAVMASVEGVDATATSYYLTCPTDESSVNCVLGSGLEVVEGLSVLEVHYTELSVGTIDVSCNIASNTATCTSSVTTLDLTVSNTATVSSMVTSTGTATVTDIDSYSMPVTVTAGLDKLNATSSTSTGGASRITQNAILAGAAAVIGGALLM